MLIPQTSVAIAEPIDVQIDELGNAIVQMYQLIGIVSDVKLLVLENILNYMNEQFF